MKKTTLVVFLLAGIMAVQAQPTKPGTKPVTKPVTKPATPLLKNATDSVSYVMGEIAAFYLIQQGLGEVKINNAAFTRALDDILGKKKTLIDDVSANALLNNYMVKLQEDKAKTHIAEGSKFLAENKVKPGVITTSSGLQYKVVTMGTGIKPTLKDTFVVHYRGTLLNGTEFDASYKKNQPLVMGVSQVIDGWKEGLQLMPIGSKFIFYIPYHLGYGKMDQGQIPGGSTLVFEVEMLDVRKAGSQ